jgi:molybdopterin/thiamine biosynthesis adenylyltransferase
VKGALTRQLAVSGDGSRGYLQTELYDYDLALRTGAVVATGGGLAVYDLTATPFGDPWMTLLHFVPTCSGVGEVRVLPRPSPPGPSPLRDLVALTCAEEGTLLLYDDEVGAVVARIALDPSTGRPRLGGRPFGMAVEERDQCTGFPGTCTRLYVASFGGGFVNLLELDKWAPQGIGLVKRIGREQD